MPSTNILTTDNAVTPLYATVPLNTPIVDIKNLNVKNKDQYILKNINLEIPKNKITVLLGPSGCGKTTLFEMPEQAYRSVS